jgi:hypothetical protein
MNTILTNLHKAREVLANIPEAAFVLAVFRADSNTCGTIACAVGHLSMDPHFAGFLRLDQITSNHAWILSVRFPESDYWGQAYQYEHLDGYFGPDAFGRLFEPRSSGSLDCSHPGYSYKWNDGTSLWIDPDVTDKALAIWRIDQQIAQLKG